MTGETVAELRALVERLRSDPLTWESAHATIREAADAIDGMLARLAAAEADADQLAASLTVYTPKINGLHPLHDDSREALRLHDDAVALRDPR